MQRISRFLIVLMALVAISLGSIACEMRNPWATPSAPAMAPPPSEAERVRTLEKKVAFIEGYQKGQRSVAGKCQKGCSGERRRPAKPAKTEAPPAPVPPAIAPPAPPKAPVAKPVTMTQAVPLFIFNGSKQDAVDIINAIKGSSQSVSTAIVENPCCPPAPPPAPASTRYTFPPAPEHRTPDIAPADVPPADYYQQPVPHVRQPPSQPTATLQAPPQKGRCNGGRPCYR